MAKAHLICGRICCGKSTYARALRAETGAVLLSVDEIMLALFGHDAGEMHDEYASRVQQYLFKKSLEIIEGGTDVILDWGFWSREKRIEARCFYASRNIECLLHYICVTDEQWRMLIRHRNQEVLEGGSAAYTVDEGLLKKHEAIFEEPEEDEADIWVQS